MPNIYPFYDTNLFSHKSLVHDKIYTISTFDYIHFWIYRTLKFYHDIGFPYFETNGDYLDPFHMCNLF